MIQRIDVSARDIDHAVSLAESIYRVRHPGDEILRVEVVEDVETVHIPLCETSEFGCLEHPGTWTIRVFGDLP